jgi:hypothetical protein
MTTKLTEHFVLEELTCTQQRDLDNQAPAEVVETLRETAERMEEVRRLLGDRVITVSSGYRSAAVNSAVGGAPRSAHLTGHAVDFNCYAFGTAPAICRAIAGSALAFDQLIQEGTWVHISFAPAMRRQVLTRRGHGYAPGLPS